MKYLQDEGFSVGMSGDEEYRASWDRIFGKPVAEGREADGHFLQMDSPVYLVERKGGVEVSREEVGGEVILQIVLQALETELRRAAWERVAIKRRKDGTGVAGSPGRARVPGALSGTDLADDCGGGGVDPFDTVREGPGEAEQSGVHAKRSGGRSRSRRAKGKGV
jgi:hypothetical protein